MRDLECTDSVSRGKARVDASLLDDGDERCDWPKFSDAEGRVMKM